MARPEKVAVVEEIREQARRLRRRSARGVPRAEGGRARRAAGRPAARRRRVQDLQEHAGPPGRRGSGPHRPRPDAARPDGHRLRHRRRGDRGQGAAGLRQGPRGPDRQGRPARHPHADAPATSIALADVPPREVLLARLAGGFQAPMVKAAGLFQAFTRNFAYGVKALVDQRVEGGEALEVPAEPEPEAPPKPPTHRRAEAEAEHRGRSRRPRPRPPSAAPRPPRPHRPKTAAPETAPTEGE